MKINFLTVNFNTSNLLNHLIKSVDKFVPDYHIYIFDNSCKSRLKTFDPPFKTDNNNVTIFDNTKGQIINFDKWLSNYPNKHLSLGRKSDWGSAKHTKSVDIAMDMIDDNFILCDTDILLKKDVSDLWDESKIYVGEIENWGWGPGLEHNNRVLPYMSFINNKMCKKLGIRYFDDKHMDGLYNPDFHADSFDTGGYFYLAAHQYDNKVIKLDDYLVHFQGGSYAKRGRNEKLTEEQWLRYHKSLFSNEKDETIDEIRKKVSKEIGKRPHKIKKVNPLLQAFLNN